MADQEQPPGPAGERREVGWMGGEYDRDEDRWEQLPLAQRIVALVSALRAQDGPNWHVVAVKQVEKELAALPAARPEPPAIERIIAKWEARADRGFNPEESDEIDAYWQGVRAVCAELRAAVHAQEQK